MESDSGGKLLNIYFYIWGLSKSLALFASAAVAWECNRPNYQECNITRENSGYPTSYSVKPPKTVLAKMLGSNPYI